MSFKMGGRCFNPSQVGYKLNLTPHAITIYCGFNPSQVGYKLEQEAVGFARAISFNPSQVGYKLGYLYLLPNTKHKFQSLTGRLQTRARTAGRTKRRGFQSLTGRLQTCAGYNYRPYPPMFQSLTGRLQTCAGGAGAGAGWLVSIPHR